MPRFLASFLITSFLISPLTVFAQEMPEESPEAVAEPSEVPFQSIPIYIFASEEGDVLGIIPIAENLAVGCVSHVATSTEVENLQETPPDPTCFLWDPNSGSTTPVTESGAGVDQHIYTGYEYDQSTGLNYAGARYQSPTEGRFTSQDAVFQDSPEKFLEDPQQLNSYSYSRNNPLRYVDPNGQFTVDLSGNFIAPFFGPIGAGVASGVRIEIGPRFGRQYYSSLSVGAGGGGTFQARIDPFGKLDPGGEYDSVEFVAAQGLGGVVSNQVNYNPNRLPAFFSEGSRTSVGAAVGVQTSASYSHSYVGEPKYLFGDNNTSRQNTSNAYTQGNSISQDASITSPLQSAFSTLSQTLTQLSNMLVDLQKSLK